MRRSGSDQMMSSHREMYQRFRAKRLYRRDCSGQGHAAVSYTHLDVYKRQSVFFEFDLVAAQYLMQRRQKKLGQL